VPFGGILRALKQQQKTKKIFVLVRHPPGREGLSGANTNVQVKEKALQFGGSLSLGVWICLDRVSIDTLDLDTGRE
jgi:hypothetical protein